MIYELRVYRFHPGQKKTFLRGFKKARMFMKKYGVAFVSAWENEERDDEFIWIRSFPSLKAREKATRAYYESSEWLAIRHLLTPTIRRREVRLMKAIPYDNLER